MQYTAEELKGICEKHIKWLRNEEGGDKADLSRADLSGADLSGADLDMSCFPLKCGTLYIKTTKRLRVQLAFHFLSLIRNGAEVTDEEKEIYEHLRAYANEFHRTDVKKLEKL